MDIRFATQSQKKINKTNKQNMYHKICKQTEALSAYSGPAPILQPVPFSAVIAAWPHGGS